MMLHTHHQTIASLSTNRDLKYLIRDYFALPIRTALLPAMLARGLGQADLVLCLLRLRDTHRRLRRSLEEHITILVGHPICIGPPCLQHYRDQPPGSRTTSDARRLTFVHPTNPRAPRTDAYLRWPEYKVGRTIEQLLIRGVTRRDLRRALKHGWVRLEETQKTQKTLENKGFVST